MEYEKVAVLILLCSFLVSAFLTWFYGRQIGDTSCKFSPPLFSPAPRAFGIWSVIYTFWILNIVMQLSDAFGKGNMVADPTSNVCIAASWMLAGLWVAVFSGGDRIRVTIASFILLASAGSALAASFLACDWSVLNYERMFTIGLPASLLAGWLCVASTLAIGIAVKANDGVPDTCVPKSRSYSILDTPNNYFFTLAPISAAVLVSLWVVLAGDPVVGLPVVWGIVNMHSTTINRVAVVWVVASIVLSIVLLAA